MTEIPTEEEFRKTGFTFAASQFPLSEKACQWIADFNGIDIKIIHETWKYAPNEYMRKYIESKVK